MKNIPHDFSPLSLFFFWYCLSQAVRLFRQKTAVQKIQYLQQKSLIFNIPIQSFTVKKSRVASASYVPVIHLLQKDYKFAFLCRTV